MFFTDTSYIGVDIPGQRRPLTYCALDADLNLLALGRGAEGDVLAFINGQGRAFVAINNPRSVNMGLMAQESYRASLRPSPKPGRWERWRAAEYQMRMHRIKVHRTPHNASHAPGWMRIGFGLFRELEERGFQPFTDQFSPQMAGGQSFSVETYPHAAFTALLGCIPFHRNSLEGRIQRQLALFINNVDLPDPMQVFEEITRHRLLKGELDLEGLLEPSELDAVVAAYTAFTASKGEVTLLGHRDEGQIAVPVKELLSRYA